MIIKIIIYMDKDKKKKYQKAIILSKKFEPKKIIKELGKKDKIKQIKELLNIEDESNDSIDKEEYDESEENKNRLLQNKKQKEYKKRVIKEEDKSSEASSNYSNESFEKLIENLSLQEKGHNKLKVKNIAVEKDQLNLQKKKKKLILIMIFPYRIL